MKSPISRLSPAQRLVLTRIGQGIPQKAIAAELKISERGVRWHRTQIKEKLKLKTLADAVRAAIKFRLVVL